MRTLLIMIILLVAAGCTDRKPAPERTVRERDSIIAESMLPGAQGVGGALRAADAASERQRRTEAID